MGIGLGSSFTRNAAIPLDDSAVTPTLTTRDAIGAGTRYEGMTVYCTADTKTYQLQGGILNSNWAVYGGSAPVANYVCDTFTGDGTTTVFTLSQAPAAKTNISITFSGASQHQSTFSYSTTSLTFSSPPPSGVAIEVKYGVVTATVGDGSITLLKLAPANKIISSSCGAFSTTSTTAVDVTNLTGSITTTGRDVQIKLLSDASGADSQVGVILTTGPATGVARILIIMDGTTEVYRSGIQGSSLGAGQGVFVPASIISTTVTGVSAGAHTFKIQLVMAGTGTPTGYCNNSKLQIRELS